ncbi:MAG: AraC family transcriptional regulator [Succinivibrio sp.]|nr:AraC family transcriptional regulator [Succinivibrio sp.]
MIDHANIAMGQGALLAAERASGLNDNMVTSHFHAFYEIYYLESGIRTFVINDKEYAIRPQTLVLLPPYTMHYSFGGPADPFCRVVVYFDPQLLPGPLTPALSDTQGVFTFTSAATRNIISQLIDRIVLELQDDNPLNELSAKSLLYYTAIQIIRMGDRQAHLEHDDKIKSVIRHLTDHYMEELSLDKLAEKFFISKFHLCREFKRYTNSTVIEYLNSIRILNAQRLFLESNLNLTAIASEVGFASLSHFERIFHKITGMTPKQNLKQSRDRKQLGHL